jgi:hypothetical protein
VNGEGYLLPEAYLTAVINLYTEESLKIVAKKVAPDCITYSNAAANRKYKSQQL